MMNVDLTFESPSQVNLPIKQRDVYFENLERKTFEELMVKEAAKGKRN